MTGAASLPLDSPLRLTPIGRESTAQRRAAALLTTVPRLP